MMGIQLKQAWERASSYLCFALVENHARWLLHYATELSSRECDWQLASSLALRFEPEFKLDKPRKRQEGPYSTRAYETVESLELIKKLTGLSADQAVKNFLENWENEKERIPERYHALCEAFKREVLDCVQTADNDWDKQQCNWSTRISEARKIVKDGGPAILDDFLIRHHSVPPLYTALMEVPSHEYRMDRILRRIEQIRSGAKGADAVASIKLAKKAYCEKHVLEENEIDEILEFQLVCDSVDQRLSQIFARYKIGGGSRQKSVLSLGSELLRAGLMSNSKGDS